MCAWHSCKAAVHMPANQHMKQSLFLTMYGAALKALVWLV
jgi:hypothetical protein